VKVWLFVNYLFYYLFGQGGKLQVVVIVAVVIESTTVVLNTSKLVSWIHGRIVPIAF
jgi:hypothetical protein